jgi:hypothetical protein
MILTDLHSVPVSNRPYRSHEKGAGEGAEGKSQNNLYEWLVSETAHFQVYKIQRDSDEMWNIHKSETVPNFSICYDRAKLLTI